MNHPPPGWLACACAFAAAAFVGACANHAPPERFHTLLPTERAEAAAMEPTIAINVARVSVPAQANHAQWAVRQPDGSLRLLEQERWAAPLPDELRAALVDRLRARWAAIDVRGVAAARAAWHLRVEVQRFESIPGREARLEAAWSVSPSSGDAAALACRIALTEPVSEAGVPALASAHRRAAQRLADVIGERLRQMQAGRAAGC